MLVELMKLRTYLKVETWHIYKCLIFLGEDLINLQQILSWIHHMQSDGEEFCSCSVHVIWPDWCATGIRRILQTVFLWSGGTVACSLRLKLLFGLADEGKQMMYNTEGYWGSDFWKALFLKINCTHVVREMKGKGFIYVTPCLFSA